MAKKLTPAEVALNNAIHRVNGTRKWHNESESANARRPDIRNVPDARAKLEAARATGAYCKVCQHSKLEVINQFLIHGTGPNGTPMSMAGLSNTFGLKVKALQVHKAYCIGTLAERAREVMKNTKTVEDLINTTGRIDRALDKFDTACDKLLEYGSAAAISKLAELFPAAFQYFELRAKIGKEIGEGDTGAASGKPSIAVIMMPTGLPAGPQPIRAPLPIAPGVIELEAGDAS